MEVTSIKRRKFCDTPIANTAISFPYLTFF